MAAFSNANRPTFPVENVGEPHVSRPLRAKLAPLDGKIWASEMPFWLRDARVIKVLVDACAASIEGSIAASATASIYQYIVSYEKQSAFTANSADQANVADASLQRLLLHQFPEIYRCLTPDQIHTAIGLSENHAVVDVLLKYAAVSQIVAWVHDSAAKLTEGSISTFPLAYLKKDALDVIDWDGLLAAPGGVYSLNDIPATPGPRSTSAAQATTITDLKAKLAAAEAQIPAQDSQEALRLNAARDRAAAARLLAAEDERAAQRRRLNPDGEFGFRGRPVLAIEPSARAVLLAAPALPTALGNDKNALFDPYIANQLKNGLWPGWSKLHASFLGGLLDGNGKITVETNPNGSGVGFAVIRSANSKQIPVTPADYLNAIDVLTASLREHSPADADHLNSGLLKLVVGYVDLCDNDPELVITVLDIELRSYIAALKTGIAGHVPGSTPGGLPGPTQRVLDAAHRRLDQVRDVTADEHALSRRPKAKARKSKAKGKHKQKHTETKPKFGSGTAHIGKHTKLVLAQPSQVGREACNNHARGRPCPTALANGNCIRMHIGKRGARGPAVEAQSSDAGSSSDSSDSD